MALNPTTLDESQGSEVITQIFESNKIMKWVKRLFITVIILFIFVVINFLVSLYGSGIFTQ